MERLRTTNKVRVRSHQVPVNAVSVLYFLKSGCINMIRSLFFLHIHTEPCPYFVGLLHTVNNLTEIKTRSIQIHDLSQTNLDTLSTHAPPSRRPVLISLRLSSGPHPASRVQDLLFRILIDILILNLTSVRLNPDH